MSGSSIKCCLPFILRFLVVHETFSAFKRPAHTRKVHILMRYMVKTLVDKVTTHRASCQTTLAGELTANTLVSWEQASASQSQ